MPRRKYYVLRVPRRKSSENLKYFHLYTKHKYIIKCNHINV